MQCEAGLSVRTPIFFCEGQPPRTTNRQPPLTANREPPTATNRQPPTATNRQPRTANRHQPLTTANLYSILFLWSCVLPMS